MPTPLTLLLTALSIGLAPAGARALDADAGVPVVVTIQPLGLLVAAVGGQRVAVTTLVPPGASPHHFEPQVRDVVAIQRAALLVSVGGGLDAWLEGMMAAASSDARREHLLPNADGANPHVWLDPIRVRDEFAPALARALAAVDPDHASHYRERLGAFQRDLDQLDHEIRTMLAGRGRGYVAFHAAWTPFAARYGLEEVAVVEESPGEEPTPRALTVLIRSARRHGVRAILVEPQLDPRIASILADEFDARLVQVDPLGDPADPERASYTGLMRWNTRAFAQALGEARP